MDIAAELTLQIIRLLHELPDPPRSPARWTFWPDGRDATWSEARAYLAATPKPLMVSPLLEPGHLGCWTVDALSAARRARVEEELANGVGYLRQKLGQLGLPDDAHLRFEAATPALTIGIADFIGWAGQYALNVGIGMQASLEPGVGRLIVRPTGGNGPPLGTNADPYGLRT